MIRRVSTLIPILGVAIMTIPAPAAQPEPVPNAEDSRARQAVPELSRSGVPAAPALRHPAGQPRIRRPARRPLIRRARKKDIDIARDDGSPRWRRRSTAASCRATGRSTTRSGRTALKYAVWSAENDNRFAFDPRIYGEYISDSVFLLFTQSTLPRERNVAERRQADHLHPEGRRGREGEPEEPAEDPHRDRHQAEPRRDRVLREGHLRRSPRRRRAATARDAVQATP